MRYGGIGIPFFVMPPKKKTRLRNAVYLCRNDAASVGWNLAQALRGDRQTVPEHIVLGLVRKELQQTLKRIR